MADNNLKHLSRLELLEILIEQGKQLEALEEKNSRLTEENASLRAELDSRKIMLEEAGSIAKASLEISGVFEAAQKAADTYLENVQRLVRESVNVCSVDNPAPASVIEPAAPSESTNVQGLQESPFSILEGLFRSAVNNTKSYFKKD